LSPDHTVTALRDILARANKIYERGFPVRLAAAITSAGFEALATRLLWFS
jgi:hypothetical protein